MTRPILRRPPADWKTDSLHAARVGAVVLVVLLLALSALRPGGALFEETANVQTR